MLGDIIRNLRRENDMSQDELADKLGVSRQSISLWETGQTQPSLDNIISLASIFNVSTDTLLINDGVDEKSDECNDEQLGDAEDSVRSNRTKQNRKIILFAAIAVAVILIITSLIFLIHRKTSQSPSDTDTGEMSSAADETVIHTENSAAVSATVESAESGGSESESQSDGDTENSAPQIVSNNDIPVQDNDYAPIINEMPTADEEPPAVIQDSPVNNDPPKSDRIYAYFKKFAIDNGVVNGDYSAYSKPADNYGGYSGEDFSLSYWGDTDTVEFCLHSVLNETFSINFYLRIPKEYTGEYTYISSYYYRSNGSPLYEAKGTIRADEFTDAHPLYCEKYIGNVDDQNSFMEMSREGICDLLRCLKSFLNVENTEFTFADLGFVKF